MAPQSDMSGKRRDRRGLQEQTMWRPRSTVVQERQPCRDRPRNWRCKGSLEASTPMDSSTPSLGTFNLPNFKRKTSMNNQVHDLLGQSWETNAPALSSTQFLLSPRVDSTVAPGTPSLEQLWQIPARSLGPGKVLSSACEEDKKQLVAGRVSAHSIRELYVCAQEKWAVSVKSGPWQAFPRQRAEPAQSLENPFNHGCFLTVPQAKWIGPFLRKNRNHHWQCSASSRPRNSTTSENRVEKNLYWIAHSDFMGFWYVLQMSVENIRAVWLTQRKDND